jgi:hypothetical protein
MVLRPVSPASPDFPAGLTAWLLRNFTSRLDDGAPAFAGIVFTAAVVASASADDGALLPPIAVGTS